MAKHGIFAKSRHVTKITVSAISVLPRFFTVPKYHIAHYTCHVSKLTSLVPIAILRSLPRNDHK